MATHSRILAWRIPWAEEPGGLQLWGHKESDTTDFLSKSVVKHFHFPCEKSNTFIFPVRSGEVWLTCPLSH